jgi:hypothetical protein
VTPQELVKQYPVRRIKPYDGMIVTADVWEEAHDYHVRQQRYHMLLNHGAGVVTGLQVIASDPPDSSVYILPGIAVDSLGQTIILPEPLSFDMGSAQGALHLVISYGESKPRPDENAPTTPGTANESTLYIQAQYGLEALGVPPDPNGLQVELARVRRQGAQALIADAPDALHPAVNQIDLRFRREMGAKASRRAAASVAVCYLAGTSEGSVRRHGRGASFLARALRQAGAQVWVDDGMALVSPFDLNVYTLVYLVAQGTFQLKPDEMNVLYAYLQAGGTILFEACRQESTSENGAADATFLDLLSSFGVKVSDLEAGHALLTDPNLFGVPPAGFETEGTPGLKLGDGVIISTFDYGCLWQGERRGRPATREEIRAALEFGGNVVAHALARRKQAGQPKV